MSITRELTLKAKYIGGTLFYLSYYFYALQYSRLRDRMEQKFSETVHLEGFVSPGKLLQAKKTERGAHFYFENVELEVYFLQPDFLRVEWLGGLAPIPYGIAKTEWTEVDFSLESVGESWQLTSSELCLIVENDGCLKLQDSQGKLVREELPPQRQGNRWIHQAKLKPEESLYGLGERAMPLNLRLARETTEKGEVTDIPKTLRMWNYDAAGMYGPGSDPMYICIPVYIGLNHQGSYLIFYENSFEATVQFGEVAKAEFPDGALRYYLAVGEVPHLIERYTELTGRPPLPPRWALGYHQSHWGYRTEEAVRDIAQQFKAYDLPLNAIHLDIDVQVGFRAFTIDPDRFPRLPQFIQELEQQGVKFIAILNPGVKYSRKSNLFLEGQLMEAFCRYPDGQLVKGPVWPGWCVFPDFTKPEVRAWWSRQYAYLLDVGVGGFWHDMNEPAAFILWGDRSLPKVTQHHMEGRGGSHREAHNIYGLLQAQAGYCSLREYRPENRPFIVSRAGWAGLQRYAWTWTGDVACTWEAMRQTIATVVGLGLSGIPYSGSDIGGFQGNPSPELYLRWLQMSCFMTFCRTHSANNVEDRNPWTHGEPYLGIIRDFLKLRDRLMPYFYTLSWQASQTGYPPVRPVFWADPTNSDLWSVDDGFLLGDRLLIYPVFGEGERRRTIEHLPSGVWYDFWSGTAYPGGQSVTLDAPLEQVPLLVKAGTLLPMQEGTQLTLHLYLPTEPETIAKLYSDSGDGFGPWRLDEFSIRREGNVLTIQWQEQGEFPWSYETLEIQVHGAEVTQVQVDDQESLEPSHLLLSRKFITLKLWVNPESKIS